jgi:hypothetical protein
LDCCIQTKLYHLGERFIDENVEFPANLTGLLQPLPENVQGYFYYAGLVLAHQGVPPLNIS